MDICEELQIAHYKKKLLSIYKLYIHIKIGIIYYVKVFIIIYKKFIIIILYCNIFIISMY